MKVFLSSTFKDLEQYRSAVMARLRRLDGVEVRCMEDFGSRTLSPKDFCLQEAQECDLFIGLVGHLYGFVPEGDDLSMSAQEYDAAEHRDKLMFVAPDTLPVPFILMRGDSSLEKQEAFRTRVLETRVVELDWLTPETLAAGVVSAVRNWERAQVGVPAGAASQAGIDLVSYASRCRKRWEIIDLSTLTAPGASDNDVDVPRLSQVFIPQACRRSRPAVSLPRDYLHGQGIDPNEEEGQLEELRLRWHREERLAALDLLASNDATKLVLLGDPGAGKSALTRFALLRLLDPLPDNLASTDWRCALNGTWPVLVELRDLLAREAEGRCNDLLSYLAYVGETQGFGFNRASLEVQLRNRPTLLIVDGLDEVFSLSRRRAIVEEIVGLETRFPLARVLATSRIAGFDAKPFEAAGYTIATLDDLDTSQIHTFADYRFRLAFPGEPEKAKRAQEHLLEELKRRPQLSAIAGNPLILTIMTVIARHRRLARSRTQLYAQALEVLCYAWDYRRGLALPADSPLSDLQPEDTLFMLRRIAWSMQESEEGLKANALSAADLKGILTEFFSDDWRFDPPKARRAASEMMTLLQERNWVLTSRGPELYGFVHRTFLEYLVALDLAQRFEAQEISMERLRDDHVMRRIDDDNYSEVIRLLCGQLPVGIAGQLVQGICPAADHATSEQRRMILAWQALGELDPRFLTDARPACEASIRALFKWLGSCDARGWRGDADELANAVAMIEPGSWPSTPLADEDFPLSHAQNVRNSETVVRALAKGFWLPHDVLRERLFALRHSRNWVERRGAVLILGSECSQVSGVFEFICARAENDDNVRVRAAAIRMLAEHFADRSAVFDIIQRCSAEAKDDWTREGWVVARTAIDMLVSRFADQTWHLLEGLTESDDESTRASAIQMLGENLSHRPAVVALLLRCAEADRSLWVRECAERALAAYFAQLAGSLAFFNQQAHNEPSALARRYATLEWARRQTSNLRRMLLARKLSLGASDMGIDPHDMIDSDRIIAAARECFQSPNAIRSEYERIVRDDGFPLRLSWLERGN